MRQHDRFAVRERAGLRINTSVENNFARVLHCCAEQSFHKIKKGAPIKSERPWKAAAAPFRHSGKKLEPVAQREANTARVLEEERLPIP